ncbi:MAG: tRNA uridine-5-carboxymethylaminomethyl(34) synthesis enzyme MnmG [Deltaproteobacteria bacterium]|nr:tRNA uridine-5-carboxymethylaminomethyl(34) synthesis enzyme MnmG [Deltaproteobacteria bacterium]
MEKSCEVIVVGGGHAGCEAALASSRMGCETLLFNINLDSIALMSCNPAIGGTGKGQLVREIDALGGEMGKVADATVLHCRELNASKGPAVRATRFQCDKQLYRLTMKEILEKQSHLAIKQSLIESLVVENRQVIGVIGNDGVFYRSRKVIITTGTFLNGLVHIGKTQIPAGRAGEEAAVGLARSLQNLGLEMGRMKTGTPPRLRSSSIDFSLLTRQDSDENILPFSHRTESLWEKRIPSYFSQTNSSIHHLIRENIVLSPLYSGVIKGVSARYCPSLEDKVMRFPQRESHPVVLEYEGLHTEEIYAKGLGNCLPPEIQEKIVHSVPGLESAQIMRWAYAIEYDFVQPTQLLHTLETKAIQGLYLAGQINGTSGYEEAAAQGLCAGINASLAHQGRQPFILSRAEAYIGVLIDDLVTRGVDEPYRMFTSRAEHRLIIREDNAALRLTQYGYRLGLVDEQRAMDITKKIKEIDEKTARLKAAKIYPTVTTNETLLNMESTTINNPVSLFDLLKRTEINYEALSSFEGWEKITDPAVKRQIEIEAKYEGYIKRQYEEIAQMKALLAKEIPAKISYENIPGISAELKAKLQQVSPTTVGQAQRIKGMTFGAINALLIELKKQEKQG